MSWVAIIHGTDGTPDAPFYGTTREEARNFARRWRGNGYRVTVRKVGR